MDGTNELDVEKEDNQDLQPSVEKVHIQILYKFYYCFYISLLVKTIITKCDWELCCEMFPKPFRAP